MTDFKATWRAQATPMTGQDVPDLAAFDDAITALMTKFELPGGQLAVAKDARLVLNRGYGLADVDKQEPVLPESLFRIASVSKPFTAVAILTLVDSGKLTLDTKAFPLLDLEPPLGATVDPRYNDITVEHLLVHAGGWDRVLTGVDPTFLPWSRMAAATVGVDDPPDPIAVIRFMLGLPLDFDPGSKSVYSNFGILVLGRIIERVSGQTYGDYVRDQVLIPAGITDMRIGRTRLEDRAPREVRYYSPPGLIRLPSVFWGEGFVPAAYGSFYLETTDAHGGWIASAADLVRFTLAVDGQRGTPLLTPAMVQAMLGTTRPKEEGHGSGWNNEPVVNGLGWDIKPVEGGFEWSKGGALTGSVSALPFRRPDGLAFAFTFNTLPNDDRSFFHEAGETILAVADTISSWPEHDLYGP
jgi:N-acyl-D-amino-acid deacylase